MNELKKFLIVSLFFGDSLVQNVFPNRDNPKDQILCILIQAIYILFFSIPLLMLLLPILIMFLPEDSANLFWNVILYTYLFIYFTLLIPVILNIYNKEYSFPKSMIEIYFILKILTIRPIKSLFTLVLFILVIFFLFTFSYRILSLYPQIKEGPIIFGYIALSLVLIMLFLESTTDKLSRAIRQFWFWLIIFIGFIISSLTNLSLYVLPRLNEESSLNLIIVLIGLMFNFAQVLSSGRTVYTLSLYQINKENLLQKAYNKAFTYTKLLSLLEEYKNSQKILFTELKHEIKRIGLKRTSIVILASIPLISFILYFNYFISKNSEKLELFFDYIINFFISIWVLLWGGDKNIALLAFLLLIIFYCFFDTLNKLLINIRQINFVELINKVETLVFLLILIFGLIFIMFNADVILSIIILPLIVLLALISITGYIIKLFKSK